MILIVSMAIPLSTLPTTKAHTPAWQITTYAFIAPTPNPVGVGQPVTVVMWLLFAAPTSTGGDAGDRWSNLKVTVAKSDGTNESLGKFMADPTGSTYTTFTPTAIGNYTFYLEFPGQVLSLYNPVTGKAGGSSAFVNDTYLPSTATATLVVQQEAIREPASYPLPTEYWTRPINAQFREWYAVSVSWLAAGSTIGAAAPYNDAPESPHVLWKIGRASCRERV